MNNRFHAWAFQNFPFMESTFKEIDNYHLMMQILHYLKEQLKDYRELVLKVEELENWFKNLDVQEEINNKLDEMASDGTLAEIIEDYTTIPQLTERVSNTESNLDKLSQIKSIINIDNLEEVADISQPNGTYAQSIAYNTDNGKVYVCYTGVMTDNLVIRTYTDNSFETMESEVTLSVTGHGNSMCYFNGKLYLCEYSTQHIYVINPNTMEITKTITLPINVRAYNICLDSYNRVVITEQFPGSGMLNYNILLPDKRLQYVNRYMPEIYNSYRNGIKHIKYANTDFMAYCTATADRKNAVQLCVLCENYQTTIVLSNNGMELQDCYKPIVNDNYLYLLYSGDTTKIYRINISALPSDYSSPIRAQSGQTNTIKCLYTGNDVSNKRWNSYDSLPSGAATRDIVTSFIVPTFGDGINYSFSVSDAIISGSAKTGFKIPINTMYDYNNIRFMTNGYLEYSKRDKTGSALGFETTNTEYYLSGCKIKVNEMNQSGVVSSQHSYDNYDDLKAYINQNHFSFILGNIFPTLIYAMPYQVDNGYNLNTDYE